MGFKLKEQIEIGDKTCTLELFSIKNSVITKLKFDDNIFSKEPTVEEQAVEEKKKKISRYKRCSTVDDILSKSGEYTSARLYKSVLKNIIENIQGRTIYRIDLDDIIISFYRKNFKKVIRSRTAERYATGYICYMLKHKIIKPLGNKKYRKDYVLVDKTKKDNKKEIEPELYDGTEIKELLETAEMQIVKDDKKETVKIALDVLKDKDESKKPDDIYKEAVEWLDGRHKRKIRLNDIKQRFNNNSDKEINELILFLIKNKVLYQQQNNNFVISSAI